MMLNEEFIIKVADYMPVKLPKPTRKPLMEDNKVIPIISITCEGEEW